MPDNVADGGGPVPDREQSSGGHHNRRNGRRNQAARESTFKGRCDELKEAVYDVTTGKETFLKTTRNIAEYVSHTYKDAGEFRLGMINQTLPPLVEPPFPTAGAHGDPNIMDVERWKINIKEHVIKVKSREDNSQRIYGLILGQCSPAIRSRMEAHADWIRTDAASDVMGLLGIIQQCMTSRQTRKHAIHSLFDAEALVLKYTQGKTTSNHEYFEKFKDNVATAERLGSEIGVQTQRVNVIVDNIAVDTDNPTRAEINRAKAIAKDGYLATCFLMNSNRKRYGGLIRDIENEHTRGTDSYPNTLTEAYDYLVNYKGNRTNSNDSEEGGLSFYNDGANEHGGRGGRGGRGRGGRSGGGRDDSAGRGSGRSGRSGGGRGQGRGGGRGDGGAEPAEPDDAQFLLDQVEDDNLAQDDEYYCFQHSSGHSLKNTLLLDSCSSVNLVCNANLLHDIATVEQHMHVRCNAGVRSTNQQGYLGNFPDPVWFNPDGAANILSLSSVKRHYRVQFDSEGDDAFIVSNREGNTMRFTPTKNGLYSISDPSNKKTQWLFFNTVTENKQLYSKREQKAAIQARTSQNIMMFPSTRQYMNIADKSLLRNNPIERADIVAAEDIYGSNIGSLKGKTVTHKALPVDGRIAGVPQAIRDKFQSVTLSLDLFFINKIPFFLTISHGLHFGTVETIRSRHIDLVLQGVKQVIGHYARRGFRVDAIHADPEFTPLQAQLPRVGFNFCAQNEHVPVVERFIRTVKDRVRSLYNTLPFKYIPRLIIIRAVANAVFWLNAFPHTDGPSDILSPRYIMTGRHLDYKKHVRAEFGTYVQSHEQHSNDMNARTMGAICLGPTGNEQGGHHFMNLSTGQRIIRHRWTNLPMPDDVIDRVNALGRQQGMPRALSFTDRFGFPIRDDDNDVDDDHDSEYDSADASTTDDDDFDSDDYDDSESDSDNDPDGNENHGHDNDPGHLTNNVPDLPVEPTGVEENEPASEPTDTNGDEIETDSDSDSVDEPGETDLDSDEDSVDADNVGIPGVGATNVVTGLADVNNNEGDEDENPDGHPQQQYGGHHLRGRQRNQNFTYMYKFQQGHEDSHLIAHDDLLATFHEPTEQMSLRRGLKEFGKAGADAVVKELQQLDHLNAIKPVQDGSMTREQKRAALNYLMYLKQKRCGRVKARGCADGRKQRIYKTKEETSSPTVSIEALFLTAIIDAQERRDVATVDIPGAFLHSNIDELIHMRLDGPMAELLVRVNPEKYRSYVVKDRSGKDVIYVELLKALYGTLQAALLFWENLSSFLIGDLGFTANRYDRCTVNKNINGKQCTIVWHVDDLKISHQDPNVLDDVIRRLGEKYGQEAPLSITRGRVHEYLGMTLDYSVDGKVKIIMDDYVKDILDEAPDDMTGTAATPGANHLFTVNENAVKLSVDKAEKYHRMTAKLLYLSKRARPDIQPTVAFLCTRVKQPDEDDWKKLSRCIRYLRGSQGLFMTLEADDTGAVNWWIDASFATHPDLKSHTGMVMSLGKGCPLSGSWRQKLNTKSSTEAELVGVDDCMHVIVWTRNFLLDQGFGIQDNVVFQDNQSAMLLERNGRASSGRRTRHINIRYFFVADRIKHKELRVEYCPTDNMWGDFMTKALQGSKFKRMRGVIMNLPDDIPLPLTTSVSQECVGKPSYAEVVRGTRGTMVSQPKKVGFLPVTNSKPVEVTARLPGAKLALAAKSSYFATNLI